MHVSITQLLAQSIIAGLSGFLLAWIGIWMNWEYLSGDSYIITLPITKSDTEIISIDNKNRELLSKMYYFNSNNPDIYANKFNKISFKFKTIFYKSDIVLFWQSENTPGITHTRTLTITERILGFLNLKDDPNWSGHINQFGIKFNGIQNEQSCLEKVTLHLPTPDLMETLKIVIHDWHIHEPWNWRSIDHHKGASHIVLLSPVPMTVLWILLSIMILITIKGTKTKRTITYGLITFILTGWLILDIRWQWELMARVRESYDQFGNIGIGDKATSIDIRILKASKNILLNLPKEPIRIFIVNRNQTASYSKYFSYRLFYYLLPHRASVASPEILDSANLVENDFVFFPIGSGPGLLNPKTRNIADNTGNLSLIFQYNFPGAGSLYRISKGG